MKPLSAKSKPAAPSEGKTRLRVSYQGEPGANSHLACREAFPDLEAAACATFEDALAAVKSGDARYAMIPIENSVAGRVADIHHLLPGAELHIVGEHFLRVRHQLLAVPGASLSTVTKALSHTQALGQCRNTLRRLGLRPIPEADTAGSARIVSEANDPTLAASSSLAAVTASDSRGRHRGRAAQHHPLRGAVERARRRQGGDRPITTFISRVRNMPGALYKAMGGFATNGHDQAGELSARRPLVATMFYADVEGHPDDPPGHARWRSSPSSQRAACLAPTRRAPIARGPTRRLTGRNFIPAGRQALACLKPAQPSRPP